MNKIKFNTYTDESGQDTKGRVFIVCTLILPSENKQLIEEKLLKVEKDSDKTRKWYLSNNTRRHKYISLILQESITRHLTVYYSRYTNKQDYLDLIGGHIAKSIMDYANEKEYVSKIFMDKITKKEMNSLRKEIKQYHIRYKKVHGITEESSAFIRFADACCGMIRDLGNQSCCDSYRNLFVKMKEV